MEKLSDLVSRDYEEEVEIIRAAGTLWKKFLEGGAALLVAWGLSFLNGSPWGPRTQAFALLAFFTVPFALRAWDRSKVAQEMRHHREVRMEIKINALLDRIDQR